MKNHITENVGWNAYTLFTNQAFDHLDVHPDGLHEQVETYEHLGDIQTISINLHDRYKAIIEARRVIVSPEEADHSFTYEFQAPPPVIWHWMTDTEKKNLLAEGEAVFTPTARPGGRNGPGASNHCAHGKNLKGLLIETILDWRPFDYYTAESAEGKRIMRQTIKLEPLSDGKRTRLHILTLMISPSLPSFVRRPMLNMVATKMLLSNAQLIAKHLSGESETEVGISAAQVTA